MGRKIKKKVLLLRFTAVTWCILCFSASFEGRDFEFLKQAEQHTSTLNEGASSKRMKLVSNLLIMAWRGVVNVHLGSLNLNSLSM